MSKLYYRYGSMNCGKTTNLLQVAHNYEELGNRVMILKPKIDTKGGNKVVSRLGVERNVDLLIDKNYSFKNNYIFKEYACILIDEAQFLTREQVGELFELVSNIDTPIICYGLRTDFQTNGFEGSCRLLELAHDITELKNVCSCGKKATLTARFISGEFVSDGEQILIDDGNVEYRQLCSTCYYKFKNN